MDKRLHFDWTKTEDGWELSEPGYVEYVRGSSVFIDGHWAPRYLSWLAEDVTRLFNYGGADDAPSD